MSIRNRIKKLEGFKKEALNFKTFERAWPTISRGTASEGRDPKEIFQLWRDWKLTSQDPILAQKIYEIDYKNNLYSSDEDYKSLGVSEGERKALEEEFSKLMLSGRHSPDVYIPTHKKNIHGRDYQILGESDSPLETVDSAGAVPGIASRDWEKPSTKWAPYILVYRGTEGTEAIKYDKDSDMPRWLTSHPDVSSAYGKAGKSGLGSILEVFDLRKIPKENRSIFTRHVAADTRLMSSYEIETLPLWPGDGWNHSPFYEVVVSDDDLHNARIAKYKSLPGIGWMLVEGRNVLKEGLTQEEAAEHKEIFKEEMKKLIKSNPKFFYTYKMDYLNDEELKRMAAEGFASYCFAQKDLAQFGHFFSFINLYKDENSFDDILILFLENLAKERPKEYFAEFGPDLLLDPVVKNRIDFSRIDRMGLESLAEKSPTYFVLGNYVEPGYTHVNDQVDFMYLTQAKKLGMNELIRTGIRNFSKRSPKFFAKYKDALVEEGYGDIVEDVSKENMSNFESQFSIDPLKALSEKYKFNLNGMIHFIGLYSVDSRIRDMVNKDGLNSKIPEFMAWGLSNEPQHREHYKTYAKVLESRFGFTDLVKKLGLDSDEDIVEKKSSLDNHLIKLSKALESRGMKKEAFKVRYLSSLI